MRGGVVVAQCAVDDDVFDKLVGRPLYSAEHDAVRQIRPLDPDEDNLIVSEKQGKKLKTSTSPNSIVVEEAARKGPLFAYVRNALMKEVIFKHQPHGNEPQSLVLGLYPPAHADAFMQHNNRTSKELAAAIGNFSFQWNDLVPYSPPGRARDMDQSLINHHFSSQTSCALILTTDMWERAHAWLLLERAAGHRLPVMIWGGTTVNIAREWLIQRDQIVCKSTTTMSFGRISQYATNDDISFISIDDAPHASAHLMSHYEPLDVQRFMDAYGCLEILRTEPGCTMSAIIARLGSTEATRQRTFIAALDKLTIPHNDGRVSDELRHLRLVPWANTDVLIRYERLRCHLDDASFFAVLETSMGRSLHAATVDSIISWVELLGKDKFVTFICDGIAARLGDAAFDALLRNWLELLGQDKFVTFICDGIAARLGNAAFEAQLRNWLELLGKDKFVTFICNSIAARLTDDAFDARLRRWLELLGKDKFVTFICGGIAARLTDDAFDARLRNWLELLGKDKFVTFISDGIAAHLGDAAFDAQLRNWLELFGKDKFVTFICDGIAAHLGDAAFDAQLRNWLELLGKDKFVTFICNSIAARLTDDAFDVRMRIWLELLGKDKFVTFINDGIAARLTNDAFDARLRSWLELLGKDKFVTFISGSVAKRLGEPEYDKLLDEMYFIAPDVFHTLAHSDGLSARLADVVPLLRKWRPALGKRVTIFNQIASRIRCLEDSGFLEFYAAHSEWTWRMTRKLMAAIPRGQVTKVAPQMWTSICS